MVRNTFVFGFYDDLDFAINNLVKEEVLDVRFRIAFSHGYDKKVYEVFDFFSSKFFDEYEKQIAFYTEDVVFNDETYNAVYEKLPIFMDQYLRHFKNTELPDNYELLSYFNSFYRFFYSIIKKEKIDLVLFSNIPHEGVSFVVYCIAKELGIETLMVTQSLFPNKFFYVESIEDYGKFSFMDKLRSEKEFCLQTHRDNLFYMQSCFKKFTINDLFKQSLLRLVKRNVTPPKKILRDLLLPYFPQLDLAYSVNQLATEVDYSKKYVYFPLHLQPELTTSAIGGKYSDQLLALEKIRSLIPKDWYIYVKENPKQTKYNRGDVFIKRLKLLPNVIVTPRDESTFKLIEHAQFVATITGTVGWEALQRGVPVLIFGYTWYSQMEGVFSYGKNFDVSQIIGYKIDKDKLEQDVNSLLNKMPEGIVDSTYIAAYENYTSEENIKNITSLLRKIVLKLK